MRASLQKARPHIDIAWCGMIDCGRIVSCRFAMGSEGGRLAGCLGCVEAYRGGITRSRRMMNESGKGDVFHVALNESTEHDPMQLPHARPRQRALDCLASKLMPVSQEFTLVHQEPGRDALTQNRNGRVLFDQLALHPVRHHGAEV